MKQLEDNKIYYSWEDYNKDMKATDWIEFDHVVGIYRGSLCMATHLSNVRNVPMSIVAFQTRDSEDKKPYWLHNATEVDKKVNDTKSRLEKSYLQTDSQQKVLQAVEKAESEQLRKQLKEQVANLTPNNKQV